MDDDNDDDGEDNDDDDCEWLYSRTKKVPFVMRNSILTVTFATNSPLDPGTAIIH